MKTKVFLIMIMINISISLVGEDSSEERYLTINIDQMSGKREFHTDPIIVQNGKIAATSYIKRTTIKPIDFNNKVFTLKKGKAVLYLIPPIDIKDNDPILEGSKEIQIPEKGSLEVTIKPNIVDLISVHMSVKVIPENRTLNNKWVEIADITHMPPLTEEEEVWKYLKLWNGKTDYNGNIVFPAVPGRTYRIRIMWAPKNCGDLDSYFSKDYTPSKDKRQDVNWIIDTGRLIILEFLDMGQGNKLFDEENMSVDMFCGDVLCTYSFSKGRLLMYPDIDPKLKNVKKITFRNAPGYSRKRRLEIKGSNVIRITDEKIQKHTIHVGRQEWGNIQVTTPDTPNLKGYAHILKPGTDDIVTSIALNDRNPVELKPGNYKMVIHAEGFRIHEQSINVRNDEKLIKEVTLKKGIQIKIKVTDTENNPIPSIDWWKKRNTFDPEHPEYPKRAVVAADFWYSGKKYPFLQKMKIPLDEHGIHTINIDPAFKGVIKVEDIRDSWGASIENLYTASLTYVDNPENGSTYNIKMTKQGCIVTGEIKSEEDIKIYYIGIYNIDTYFPLLYSSEAVDNKKDIYKFKAKLSPGKYFVGINAKVHKQDTYEDDYQIKQFKVSKTKTVSLGIIKIKQDHLIKENLISEQYKEIR